ncbi:MAG: hypothetical protein JXA25_05595 [Anaerolineales bacterium]|nr:hypothetical protein [Anaerolineales bacterium]
MKGSFSAQDWERIRRDWGRWWHFDLDRPMVVIERLDGYDIAPELIPEIVPHAIEIPLETTPEQTVKFYDDMISRTRYYGDAFPRWYPDFGPGIVAAFLGAEPSVVDHSVWYEPEAGLSICDLQPRFDPKNPWWQRVLALTETAAAHWKQDVVVGYVDLGGNLDILTSLLNSEELLLGLIQQPDEVLRVTSRITEAWLACFNRLDAVISPAGAGSTAWAQMWAPGSFYMLQSDFSIMISPQMFEQYVLPDIAACSERMDHAFYHLDGPGAIRHLDMLLSLDSLQGIQWIPGAGAPPPEKWLPELKRIRDAGKLCQVYVTPQGAQTIMRELGGKGFCFVLFEGVGFADAEDLVQSLR